MENPHISSEPSPSDGEDTRPLPVNQSHPTEEQPAHDLGEFEARVRLFTRKGGLIPCSLASYLAGLTDTQLRRLIAADRIETEKVNGQMLIVLRSLVSHRRRVLKRAAAQKRRVA